MKKGFRVPPKQSKKDELSQLRAELDNVQMANRVSQMLIQQLMQSVKGVTEDLSAALNQLYDLQYKQNGIQKLLKVDTKALNDVIAKQRLADFEDAASKQDAKDGLVVAEVATKDSTVVITSTAQDEEGNDRGIFRSRIKLSESGVPQLIDALTGKTVGDKAVVKLNGFDHEVELLSIHETVVKEEVAAEALN